MGTIIRNNVVYGSSSSMVELSMADYEAREAAGGIDSDVMYLIPDADEYNNNTSVNTNISEFFSISKDYVKGDCCIYNNQLYEFVEDKPAGSWDERIVESTTIQNKIDELNSNMPFKFGIDGDGNYGYYGADGSLIPFNSGGGLVAFAFGNTTKSSYVCATDVSSPRVISKTFYDDYLSFDATTGLFTVLKDFSAKILHLHVFASTTASYIGKSSIYVNGAIVQNSETLESSNYTKKYQIVEIDLKVGDTIGIYNEQSQTSHNIAAMMIYLSEGSNSLINLGNMGLEKLTWIRQNSKADKATTTFDLGGKPTYLILMGWDTNQNLLPILEYKNGERKVLYDMNGKASDITITLTDTGFNFDQNMTSGQLRLFFGYSIDELPAVKREKIYSIGFGVYNRTQTNKITIDVTNYTKVRICHLYFSYNVAHTNRYFKLIGDGTEIVNLTLPIAIDNPTDGSYEYDISNVTTLDMEIKCMHGDTAYGMGAIALS